MEKLIREASDGNSECVIQLPNIPGGSKAFELVGKFCYGVKLELTATNVVHLRCSAEHLQMTEDYGDGNLIEQTERFLNQVVLQRWEDSIKALRTCDDVLSHAEDLRIVKRCIESLAMKASTDPNLLGWPMMEYGGGPMQSPGGSVLWNGISTGTRLKSYTSDWWYEDASTLKFPIYKRLISSMEVRGIRPEIIAGSLELYAKRYISGLNRRQVGTVTTAASSSEVSSRTTPPPCSINTAAPSEEEQRNLLEEIGTMLPMEKGMLLSTKFLFGMLKTAMILRASSSCVANFEKRIGMQLDQASLDDILLPNFSYSMETLYNVDCVQRILGHFLTMDQVTAGGASPYMANDDGNIDSPSLTSITTVAKLVDGFLAEVASDVNLKLPKFQSLADAVPDYARPLDDGLYRAIDIYLKVKARFIIDHHYQFIIGFFDLECILLLSFI